MPKGNPNPKTEHLREYRFESKGRHKNLAKQSVSVRLPRDLDKYVRSLPNRNQWMIEAILDKALEDMAHVSREVES